MGVFWIGCVVLWAEKEGLDVSFFFSFFPLFSSSFFRLAYLLEERSLLLAWFAKRRFDALDLVLPQLMYLSKPMSGSEESRWID